MLVVGAFSLVAALDLPVDMRRISEVGVFYYLSTTVVTCIALLIGLGGLWLGLRTLRHAILRAGTSRR
jgi:hypothetical protein